MAKPRPVFAKLPPNVQSFWYEHFGPHSGLNTTAVVIYINHYLKYDSLYTSIPSEIGLAAFSMSEGLKEVEWTLVDPVEAPLGHGVDCMNNAADCAIPVPGYSQKYQDLNRIVNKIELFLEKHSTKEAGNVTFLVCPGKDYKSYGSSLNWLYEKSGRKEGFRRPLLKLETLVVSLSLTGLTMLVERNHFKRTLEEVLEFLNNSVSLYQESLASSRRLSKLTGSSSGNDDLTESYISTFATGVGRTTDDYCSTIVTEDSIRIANDYEGSCIGARLGVFRVEDEVSNYFNSVHALHCDGLACPYHQESPDFKEIPPRGRELYAGVDDTRPINKLHTCALLHAVRFVYLTLDVLLINYPEVKLKRGRHYPIKEEAPVVAEPAAAEGVAAATNDVLGKKWYGSALVVGKNHVTVNGAAAAVTAAGNKKGKTGAAVAKK